MLPSYPCKKQCFEEIQNHSKGIYIVQMTGKYWNALELHIVYQCKINLPVLELPLIYQVCCMKYHSKNMLQTLIHTIGFMKCLFKMAKGSSLLSVELCTCCKSI